MDNSYSKSNLDYSIGYAEHLVAKKAQGKTVLARVGIVALCVLLLGIVAILTFKIPHITVVAVVLIAYITILLWGLTKIEFEYLVVSNTMSVDKIISGK